MTLWTTALALIMSTPIVAPEQVMRTQALDPSAHAHMVEVTGWLGMMSTVQLPDSFEIRNVRCGACVTLSGSEDAGSEQGTSLDRRNWAIEVSPKERNIYLRPKEMPTADNPIAAFSTNVFITLDGGHSINLKLRLWNPREDAASAHPRNADAVLTLTLPDAETLSGRLSEQKAALLAAHAEQVQTEEHRWLLERLSGPMHCQTSMWTRPRRVDKSVVRIKSLCRASGTMPMVWAVVHIENDGDTQLELQELVLEPRDPADNNAGAAHYFVDKPSLSFAETTQAVASCSFANASSRAALWQLRVIFAGDDRAPVVFDDVVF